MAANDGTWVIAGITTPDSQDVFATHFAKLGRGGWRTVADLNELNNIPTDRREVGMVAWVTVENQAYQLIGGIGNGNWQELVIGGGPSLQAVEYDNNSDGATVSSNSINFLTSTIGFTLLLPDTPALGDLVYFVDSSGDRVTEGVTIQNNGHNVNGANDDVNLDISFGWLTFVFTSNGWVVQ